MKRRYLWLLLLALVFGGKAAAADPPSSFLLSGADYGQWDANQRLFYAAGQIQLESDGLILKGNTLLWDLDKQELLLQGDAALEQDGQIIRGESLSFNTATSQGKLTEVTGEFSAEKIEGPLFIFGDAMEIDGEDYHFQGSRLTSCDNLVPHYHLSVKNLHIYPGDRLVLHNVVFYEIGLPLFYWPYLAVPLDDRFENLDLALPEIGYDQSDGSYYIKNRYNYYLSENASGGLLFDYYTRRGLGLGVDHNYVHPILGSSRFYIYGFPFAENKDLTAYVEHEFAYEGQQWNIGASNKFRMQNVSGVDWQVIGPGSLNSTYQKENLQVSASMNYTAKRETDGPWVLDWLAKAGWNQQLAPNLRLNASSSINNATKTSTQEVVRTYDHLIEANYRLDNHSFNVALQQKYNPDLLDVSKTASWVSINRLPELTWRWQNPSYKDYGFAGRFELSIGNFTQYPKGVNSLRLLPSIELDTQSLRWDTGTTISFGGGAAGYYYQDQARQHLLHGRLSLTQKFGANLNLTATYTKRYVNGTTPFDFDRQTPQDNITGTLTYVRQPVTLSLRSGYNFLKQEYDNLVPKVAYNNRQGLTGSLEVYYNVQQKNFGNLIGQLNYTSDEGTVIGLSGTYNLTSKNIRSFTGKITFDLTEKINLGYNVNYDSSKTNKLTKGELIAVVDLHCRKLTFTYNHVRGDYKIQYSLNAFPKLPLGFGSEGFSIFTVEDLQDVIGSND